MNTKSEILLFLIKHDLLGHTIKFPQIRVPGKRGTCPWTDVQREWNFWARINPLPNGCWEWSGGRKTRNYGAIRWPGQQTAHRVAWILSKGSVTPSNFLCHKCDNPPCCNPDHMFVGTNEDNMKDMARKGRGGGPRGERCHKAKLTQEKVNMIREAKKLLGFKAQYWASLFGVSNATIFNLLRYSTWK